MIHFRGFSIQVFGYSCMQISVNVVFNDGRSTTRHGFYKILHTRIREYMNISLIWQLEKIQRQKAAKLAKSQLKVQRAVHVILLQDHILCPCYL